MRTFTVPMMISESHTEYSHRVSSMAWQFDGERVLAVGLDRVSLDGDQPVDAGFEEVVTNVG